MAKEAYQVRRELGGQIATVQAHSTRGAMVQYLADYRGLQRGEEFRVKLRGTKEWEWFRITPSGGLRKFGGH